LKKKVIDMKVDVSDEAFFSDSVFVIHSPSNFVLDFRQTTPRVDPIENKVKQTFVVKHRAIVLDPILTKDLIRVLKENIKRYEKEFGKIKVPKRKKVRYKEPSAAEHRKYIG